MTLSQSSNHYYYLLHTDIKSKRAEKETLMQVARSYCNSAMASAARVWLSSVESELEAYKGRIPAHLPFSSTTATLVYHDATPLPD